MLEKRYNYCDTEKRLMELWVNENVYAFKRDGNLPIYSIDTPPPTVSGSLHIGHIFSYTQAEIIARYKRMNGFDVFYPFGFDDNGLPTERLVEKELNISAKDLPRTEFTKLCLETTQKYEHDFKELFTSIGFSVDWNLQYQTVSFETQKLSQQSFLKLYKAKKAYLKEEPVLWCTTCQTSIAQAELDGKEDESFFNWISFQFGDEQLEIATTRPELLAGCVALFVNPEDKKHSHLIGETAKVPLYNFEVPILSDEKVDKDKGSGIVMCCTFGDVTDLEWYKTYGLDYKRVIEANGTINSDIQYIGGLSIKDARKIIIDELKKEGLFKESKKITHSIGVHERCGTEPEIVPSNQWYIDILSNKSRYIEAADEINWYPEYMKKRYLLWVDNLKWDWCISRQRYFGVPFPVWYCSSCGEIKLPREDELPINPLETKPSSPCKCSSLDFEPERAVMDTWATSSLSPYINAQKLGNKKFEPMSMRTQAHEIIRTWTFYTIVRSLYADNKMPWNDIMICGYVMAGKGDKISKSKGNSQFTPIELINKFSADGVRYWAANAKLGTDTMFDPIELSASSRFLTKLWNSARFCLMHLNDFDKAKNNIIVSSDKWILEKLKIVSKKVKSLLDKYEIGSAKHELDNFFWSDFCDNYIELVKDRLYKPEVHGESERRSAQSAVYFTLFEILKMYSIYVPFITEEIYQSFYKERENNISIHLEQWLSNESENEKYVQFGEGIKLILEAVRKKKSELNLSLKSNVNELKIIVSNEDFELYNMARNDIKACTNAINLVIEHSLTNSTLPVIYL